MGDEKREKSKMKVEVKKEIHAGLTVHKTKKKGRKKRKKSEEERKKKYSRKLSDYLLGR